MSFIKASDLNKIALAQLDQPLGVYTDALSADDIAILLGGDVVDTSFVPDPDVTQIVDCKDAVTDEMTRKREIYAAIERVELNAHGIVIFVFRQSYDLGAAVNKMISFTIRSRGRQSRVDKQEVLKFLLGMVENPPEDGDNPLWALPHGAQTKAAKHFGLTRARIQQIVTESLNS